MDAATGKVDVDSWVRSAWRLAAGDVEHVMYRLWVASREKTTTRHFNIQIIIVLGMQNAQTVFVFLIC